ncbi:MAG TPA: uracil phosphoribosyltransferase [Bacteroidales bacterium]|nr:MAG: uracil phosphoribosyltransferase [Bacteroidetes bacterium GWE2_42_24]OFY25948.1 MAG: uracil phosphoribosyltransferase [Bacteroidetes bacterium GWF2_43_11]PKP27624.1 MAG: uracil phosphoribosyltransferase [Bacteroidetes bacterium HGW-Bacteroidetes-22]HBZ66644.1 uracil phosphoribosyltransferase [Bacteroidales bacterium]
MMIQILGNQNSIFNQFIAEIRDEKIQKDPLRFRTNIERISMIFAYEISKRLNYTTHEVITSLGVAETPVLTDPVVIASILRAGLPMHQGMLAIFDKAENAFISAYRKYAKDEVFQIKVEYTSSPSLEDKTLILNDPMLATGASMALTYRELMQFGKPRHTHIVSIIASAEGIDYIKRKLSPGDYTLWVGAIDDELTAQSYIVPGLGDAGDLAFGKKNETH